MAKIRVDFRINKKSREYPNKVRKKITGTGNKTPTKAVKTLGEKVKQEILNEYDRTLSQKNARRRGSSNRLRNAIRLSEPFQEGEGTVTIKIAKNLPPYWRFVEFGIGPSAREQTYQVIGGGYSRDTKGRFSSRGVAAAGNTSSFRGGTAILTPEKYATVKRMGGSEVKLVPRKRAELARIKRKITLEFSHPGFRGHHFIRAGIIYANRNGKAILEGELKKMFDEAAAEVELV